MQSMMRYAWILALILCAGISEGQTFIGNYNGDNTIGQVGNNPAFSLTDDRAQINVVSVGANGGGNYLLFNRSALGFLKSGSIVQGTDYIRNPNAATRTMWMGLEVQGPGASVVYKKKYAFAFTTGIRYLVNSDGLDNNLFMHLGANSSLYGRVQDTLQVNNFSFTSQVFKEYNFSFAADVFHTEDQHLNVGVTAKLLAGAGALGLGIPQATFNTADNDGNAYNLTGRATIAFTPYANKFVLTNSPLNALHNATNNMGLGINVGAVYYIHVNNTFTRKKNYQARLALSVTDIGHINYSASSTSGTYAASNQTLWYRNITNNPQETFGNRIFNEYLADSVVKGISAMSRFKVSLPTALRLNADVNVSREVFYINGDLLLNLVSPSASRFGNYYATTVALTPRYYVTPEKDIAVGVPFSYNQLKQGGMGAVVFVGPFYIGCRTFFNMFVNNTFNNIDFYTGLTWRIQQQRQREKDYMMM
jgi:Family of unknown function (DUF5723)